LRIWDTSELVDENFLKTFENKKEYANYIQGLSDPDMLNNFSLPVRNNLRHFLEKQELQKINQQITKKAYAEAP